MPPQSFAAADYSGLIKAAKKDGTVRVIVELDLKGFRVEGELKDLDIIKNQRKNIIRLQDTLLGGKIAGKIKNIKRYRFSPYLALEVDSKALAGLIKHTNVKLVSVDAMNSPTLAQSIPLIGADNAWTAGYTGSGIAVAILDTGVDKTHSFLAGKVVAEACFSSSGGNATSLCPDGTNAQIGPGAGVNCDTTIDGCTHGTHVAGITAGSGVSSSGVAKDANLIPIQVFTRLDGVICQIYYGTPSCITAYNSDIMLGLEYVYSLRNTYNIAAANMSLGGSNFTTYCDSDPLKPTIDNMRSAGIATVIASGNSSSKTQISSPGCISSAVSVGASTKTDYVDYYSNSAWFLSIVAPGSSIVSSLPDEQWASFSGTSMATPHVAGAFALLRQMNPTATVGELLSALQATGVPLTDTNNIAKPRIQVDQALSAISNTPMPDIKANGSNGPVVIAQGSALSIDVSLTPGTSAGNNADWWVRADSPFGTYWFTRTSGWIRSITPIRVHGGALFALSPYSIYNDTTLPAGDYLMSFSVDANMNNVFDATFTDTINIRIQ